jgi:DNA polymerase bacteriophage-type
MIIDFETRSKADLKVCGVYLYAADPTTEVLCLSITTEDGYSILWKPGEPDPTDLLLHIIDGGIVSAHNATFEIEIWRNIMVPKFGWPEVPMEQWECTMARCAQMGLPKKLGNVGEFLELDQRKDDKGHRVMLKLSKPDKNGEFVGTSEEFQTLYDYCIQDGISEMHVHKATLPLPESEKRLWIFDQEVNRRGIPVDVPLARAVCRIWADHLKCLNAELSSVTKGEVQAVSQIQRIKKFLGKFNLSRESLGADEIDLILKEDIDPTARRVLEIRREGGAAAVAKFPAILNAVGPDDRVRGCLAYHSASTGRWGGRIIQPQNLSRGIFDEDAQPEIEAVIDVVKLRDLEILQSLYPNVGDLFGSLVRPCIQAPKGKKLIVADFAAVEARGVAWVAGQESLLDAFRKGEDVYKIQASSIYKKPVSEISKAERFFGKTCLAEGTKVLTDRGFVPIEKVTYLDRVWDGVEFVKHCGLEYNGMKEVIISNGIAATEDHEIVTNVGRIEWGEILKNRSLLQSEIISATGACLSGLRYLEAEEGPVSTQDVNAYAVAPTSSTEATCFLEKALSVTSARRFPQTRNDIGNTETRCRKSPTGYDCSIGSPPRFQDATTLKTERSTTMEVAGYSCATCGETTERRSFAMFENLKGGMIRSWKWIEETTKKVMNRGTSDSLIPKPTRETDGASATYSEKSSNSESNSPPHYHNLRRKKVHVYDLINAGPRHRFAILAEGGILIVSNCVLGAGYQLGATGFQNQCEAQGVKIDDAFAKKAINAYRQSNRYIVQFWESIQKAAIATVKTGVSHMLKSCDVRFITKGKWLAMQLPSGRRIYYYKPAIREGSFGDSLHFVGVGKNDKAWNESTYGGKLTENLVQAICRDILVEKMFKLESLGYRVIMHVHDEVVLEVPSDFGSAKEVEQIMAEDVSWAKGFPIASAVFEAERYRK